MTVEIVLKNCMKEHSTREYSFKGICYCLMPPSSSLGSTPTLSPATETKHTFSKYQADSFPFSITL